MLLSFTFGNIRSVRTEQTLHMEATAVDSADGVVRRAGNWNLLPLAAIYGANGSGKSNVLLAFTHFYSMVLSSVKLNPREGLPYKPFALAEDCLERPTSFEVQIILGGVRYRYGFEYDAQAVRGEWLYERRSGEREFMLFDRDGQSMKLSGTRFQEGRGKEHVMQPNRLFLSLVWQLGGTIANTVLGWIEGCLCISGSWASWYEQYSMRAFHEQSRGYSKMLRFLLRSDLGLEGIVTRERPMREEELRGLNVVHNAIGAEALPQDETVVEAYAKHRFMQMDGQESLREFPLHEMESEGTVKLFQLAGPIFNTLARGGLLVVDELEASLHPFLTRMIVQLFQDQESNPHGAQLIFATHDTHLLDSGLLRHDQIWFTEKDPDGETRLYSLIEFKSAVQKRGDIYTKYMQGAYGAVPLMGWDFTAEEGDGQE